MKQKDSIVIGLAGDVMLARNVNEHISSIKNYAYVWGDLLAILNSTDLNIINLETTITQSKNKAYKIFNFRADPDKIKCLRQARIDVVNIANNHMTDFYNKGLLDTIKYLNKAKIKHVGAGKNIAQATKPVIIKINNIKLGILGCTDNEPESTATKNKPGTYYIDTKKDLANIKTQIKKLKSRVDFVILSIHWGPNMSPKPNTEFQYFAHEVIDSGADLIHGHSAHIFQGIEVYKNKLILYDTGDFVDDYIIDPTLRNDLSFFYLVELSKNKITKISLIPAIISAMQVNRVFGDLYYQLFEKIKDLSGEFNTKVYFKDDEILVSLNKF